MTVGRFLRRASGYYNLVVNPKRLFFNALHSGQAMVEFAMIATVALIVLLVGIQFALIGQAALAVSQASYYAARYAAVQTSVNSSSALQTAVQNNFSPTITSPSGALNVIMATNGTDPNCTASPRNFGCQITVSVTYNATSKIVLRNPFFGIPFPNSLSSTTQMLTE
jgi:Flp pilus assembly protein TadG